MFCNAAADKVAKQAWQLRTHPAWQGQFDELQQSQVSEDVATLSYMLQSAKTLVAWKLFPAATADLISRCIKKQVKVNDLPVQTSAVLLTLSVQCWLLLVCEH